jgi:hypothetical protein
MKTRTVTVLAALTLSLCSVGAATASAGTLLSGYGGPGQGNQAILGSGLLNTPGGGHGGGSGSGGGTASGASGTSATSGSASGGSTGAAHGGKGTRSAGGAPSHESAKGSATGGSAAAGAGSAVVTQTASVSVPTLGLSGADLLYILLAVAVLVMTAVFTRQLARRQG